MAMVSPRDAHGLITDRPTEGGGAMRRELRGGLRRGPGADGLTPSGVGDVRDTRRTFDPFAAPVRHLRPGAGRDPPRVRRIRMGAVSTRPVRADGAKTCSPGPNTEDR